jgi:hypothetical protein
MEKQLNLRSNSIDFIDAIEVTLRSNFGRIIVTSIFSALFFTMFFLLAHSPVEKVPDFFFHVSAGLIDAIIIFLLLESKLVELTQLKLTGLSETKNLSFDGKDSIFNKFSNANEKILIFDTYLYNLILRTGRYDKFYDCTKKALMNNVSVTLLLLEPNSEHALLRAKEINPDDPESILSEITKCTKKLWILKDELSDDKDLNNKKMDLLTINYYNSAPPFSMYCADSEVYFSFYRPELKSTEQPQLYIPSDTKLIAKTLFSFLYNKFKELYSNSKTIEEIIDGMSNKRQLS